MDLQAALATCADPAFASDENGTIVAWNSAAGDLTGLPAARVLGRKCADVLAGRDVHGNLHCMERCTVRRLLRRGEPVHRFQLSFSSPAGVLEASVSVLCTPAGGPGGFVVIHVLEPRPGERPTPASSHEVEPAAARTGRGTSGTPREVLTGREKEVLGLLAQGADTRRIGRRLSISHATARTHVQHILDKLGVHSQVQAVVLALRHGLL